MTREKNDIKNIKKININYQNTIKKYFMHEPNVAQF